jgi:hypothetical protein
VSALAHLFWRFVDWLDYWLTLARLRVLDAACGPEPESEADRQRIRDRERLERALPGCHDPVRKEDSHPDR